MVAPKAAIQWRVFLLRHMDAVVLCVLVVSRRSAMDWTAGYVVCCGVFAASVDGYMGPEGVLLSMCCCFLLAAFVCWHASVQNAYLPSFQMGQVVRVAVATWERAGTHERRHEELFTIPMVLLLGACSERNICLQLCILVLGWTLLLLCRLHAMQNLHAMWVVLSMGLVCVCVYVPLCIIGLWQSTPVAVSVL